MLIHEAIKERIPEKPYITRESWNSLWSAGIRIMPTDTPDCCILFSGAARRPVRCWQPTATDLTADDWITTG